MSKKLQMKTEKVEEIVGYLMDAENSIVEAVEVCPAKYKALLEKFDHIISSINDVIKETLKYEQ